MRVAVFSDIHGNTIALDAVLADITARGGADAYWVLGDLVAIGAQPVQTLERLAAVYRA
jgi:predicted phosphodiesterase